MSIRVPPRWNQRPVEGRQRRDTDAEDGIDEDRRIAGGRSLKLRRARRSLAQDSLLSKSGVALLVRGRQEMVDHEISDISTQLLTAEFVKTKMLSREDSTQRCFLGG